MRVTGIIAEYNPLHLGHEFHIAESRKITGADYIITVLSGNFVQRGTPAILDKYSRTRMALEAGSDLVLELPVPYALASGEGFAFGGVSLLHQLGCVNAISFGTEAGELHKIKFLAGVLSDVDTAFCTNDTQSSYQTAYQQALKQGLTHPSARLYALKEAYPALDTSVLDGHSNNMLALEYCKALYRLGSAIWPVTIQRKGQRYLDSCVKEAAVNQCFASATAVREALNKQNLDTLSEQVPPSVASTLAGAFSENRLLFLDDFSQLLHYKLLSLCKEELTDFWEVTPDLSNKIIKNMGAFETFTQFANLLWSKDITYARVCRTLMHILLDIHKDTWDVHSSVPYARILGFRKASAPLLSEIKLGSDIPLISKLADASRLLTPEAYRLLRLDMKAAHIYDSVVLQKSGIRASHEMQRQLIIL